MGRIKVTIIWAIPQAIKERSIAMLAEADAANAIYIHTSDRLAYKTCRRKWNWNSKIRHNYRAIQRAMPLDFGTAIHAGLEVYYDAETWNSTFDQRCTVEVLSVLRFQQSMQETRDSYLVKTKQEGLSEEELDDWNYHFVLGQMMLKNYFSWAIKTNQDDFTVLATELDFVVYLFHDKISGRPVYYRGRIDFLVQDKAGNCWIGDHKTAASFSDSLSRLEFDEQLGSYNWAILEAYGLPVVGNLYNELWKQVPIPPEPMTRRYQGKLLSTAKDNAVTYDMMVEAINKYGEDINLYSDYLNWLKAEGPQFFRRTQFHRNKAELDDIERRIRVEAMEMATISEESCYPNPSRFENGHCKWCAFRTPCLAINDGSDVDWILQNNYTIGE